MTRRRWRCGAHACLCDGHASYMGAVPGVSRPRGTVRSEPRSAGCYDGCIARGAFQKKTGSSSSNARREKARPVPEIMAAKIGPLRSRPLNGKLLGKHAVKQTIIGQNVCFRGCRGSATYLIEELGVLRLGGPMSSWALQEETGKRTLKTKNSGAYLPTKTDRLRCPAPMNE